MVVSLFLCHLRRLKKVLSDSALAVSDRVTFLHPVYFERRQTWTLRHMAEAMFPSRLARGTLSSVSAFLPYRLSVEQSAMSPRLL